VTAGKAETALPAFYKEQPKARQSLAQDLAHANAAPLKKYRAVVTAKADFLLRLKFSPARNLAKSIKV
jgi:hypothetical protein